MKQFYSTAVTFSLILAVCVLLFCTSSKSFVTDGPSAKDGVLNLEEADFSSSVYALKGKWELYYGSLYTPEDIEGDTREAELMEVPGSWDKLWHPQSGCATYRLSVLTGSEPALLLYLPEMVSSCAVWANGREIYRAGQVGTNKTDTVIRIRNGLVAVVPVDGAIELVIQTADYQMSGNGLSYPILIGRDTVLTHHTFWQRVILAAALGGILLMGIYHLFLYIFRRRERLYLTFSATCMATVLCLSMETNSLVQYFYPAGMSGVLVRVYQLLYALQCLCICVFILQIFSIRLKGALRVVFILGFLLPAAGICLLPFHLAASGIFLIVIPYCVAIVLALRSGKIGRDPYNLLFLGSMVIFVIYTPLSKTLMEGKAFVPAIASDMFLTLSQCVILARSYARAQEEVERVNANLEMLVEQRTEQLSRANLQLSASQTALKEMIANISHDLKTPLAVLNNYLELLGDDEASVNEAEQAEYLSIAYHKNLDLQRLIRNLFEVTRMEGGTIIYRMEPVTAGWLAGQAEQKYSGQCRDSGISFEAEAGGESGTGEEPGEESFETLSFMIDPGKIWSILDNLVYNAIRHTPEGGRITLSIRRDGEHVRISVSDTGEGIAPEHLPHVFERFYKVSAERGEKDGSSGLGLYIVRTLTEGMGGSVRVQSIVSEGTVFILTFLLCRP